MSFLLENIEIDKNVFCKHASGTFFHQLDMILLVTLVGAGER